MDKINFSHTQPPSTELQLARWYTTSCMLITLMLIGMCSIYAMQWRTYQQMMHSQKGKCAHDALQQDYSHLLAQQKEQETLHAARTITSHQLTALNESMAQDISLNECVITRNGTYNLTLTAPSRQRAQECVALLSKKQLFGALTIASLKMVKNGDKNELLIVVKNS